jgi:CBS domain containing-hemolysin-like protein
MAILVPGLVVLTMLIVASGFFSGSETALFYLSRDDLRAMQAGGSRERIVATLLRNPDRLLTAVLFWNLLINLTYFAISVVVARRLMDDGHTARAGVVGIGSLVAIIVFGEVVPKSLAVVFHRSLALLVSWPLALAVRLLDPAFPMLGTLTRALRRGFWPHIRPEPYLHADDLERAVKTSGLTPESMQIEQQILHRILDLSEITVEEVMRPRGTYDVAAFDVTAREIPSVPTSDYLLLGDKDDFGADHDAIGSAVPLATLASVPAGPLSATTEPVIHVPWCAALSDVLQQLRDNLSNVAAAVNEFGETIGIVTYEDIIETILVEQPSRAKRVLQREPVLEVAPGRYHVDGLTTLRYLAQRLGFDYEPTADGLVTVAGLLHDKLEQLPEVGDSCEWNGFTFRVIDTPRRGKIRVMVSEAEA